MKTNTWLTLSAIAIGTLCATSAHAGWSVDVSIGVPVYYPAPPVCPPPVAYCPPPRVVYPPPVVYCPPPRPVCPPVAYVPPGHAWGRNSYYRGNRYGSKWNNGYGHGGKGRH